jgi:DNA-binding protein YbaB
MWTPKPEEQAELLKFLNLEEAESLEQAKEKIQSNYIAASEHTSKIGKITGSVTNVARKAFEAFGVTLSDEDVKDKKVEDVIRSASEKAKESYEAKIKELEARASGTPNDEIVKEWEGKYGKLEKQLTQERKAREEAASALEATKAEYEQKRKGDTITSIFEENLKKVKIDPTASPVALKGFKAHISEKYLIDLEKDAPIVKDKASGELIKNEKKLGTFMSLEEVLLKEATDLGLIQKSPGAGKPAGRAGVPQGGQAPDHDPNNKLKKLNPRFYSV